MKKWLLILILPFQSATTLCDSCDYELQKGEIKALAHKAAVESQKLGLPCPYLSIIPYFWPHEIFDFRHDDATYSIYREKFNYLIWWTDADFEDHSAYLKEHIQSYQEDLRKEFTLFPPNAEYIQHLESRLNTFKDLLATKTRNRQQIQLVLNQGLNSVTEFCSELYTKCIENHNDQNSFYERSLVYYDQGKFSECVHDLAKFQETGQKIPDIKIPSDLFLAQGIAYSNLGLYNQAIEALNEALRLDIENKEAYLERAAVYFEIGNFEKSIEDFVASNFHSSSISSEFFDFATGFTRGSANGFIEAAKHFVPSLLSSAKGLGTAIWTLAISPEQFSSEVVHTCSEGIKFLMNHSSPEILEVISPQLKELVFEWDDLSQTKRGELLGHLISKEGIEIFATAGAMKAYSKLRKANMVASLETLASSQGKEKILQHAENWGAKHEEIIRKYRADTSYIKTLRNQNLSESAIRKTLHELGYNTFPRPKGVPENFKAAFSEKKGGMLYLDPLDSSHTIRVMPGNPLSSNPKQQTPYVVQRVGDKAIDNHGKLVGKATEAAHIPLEDYVFRTKGNKP